ncbi:isopentenyl-diphosphate Delta-isomerase [Pelotomaculum propionicicum]|uniref:Isopentenyl-diphosphate delta-isomerase n=1 Tax=Pelotomaculum propionicicum TaxID=258475 RepID=A0A4Y7RVZ5_9FIRM|nr:isopentenyl-diphosphate Delta-isomerase [Pelotomaculum propionicicum]NLI11774.1 isopentenyl-diphosphate Delta-isomerase [Peptococcaceae bacterium]TEB12940.1 Isopentenyl-diphosphate Delta-isomerase [Pelotomaculum propionicicum]
MQEYVTLVDENDKVVGVAEKIDAHKNPKLHRAFSIFITNSKGEFLIQQRAENKYHCPGMWANTCCGHPRPGESLEEAAHRRLQEEMGFDTRMVKVFSFIYKTEFENGLTEKEYDHVFVGKWDGIPKKNINEVADYKWISRDILEEDIKKNPEIYTSWFKIAWEILLARNWGKAIKDGGSYDFLTKDK